MIVDNKNNITRDYLVGKVLAAVLRWHRCKPDMRGDGVGAALQDLRAAWNELVAFEDKHRKEVGYKDLMTIFSDNFPIEIDD